MLNKEKYLLNNKNYRKYTFTPLQENIRADIQGTEDYQQNFDNAYKEGEEKGFLSGFEQGKELGTKQGYQDGFDKGVDKGTIHGKEIIENKLQEIMPPLTDLKNFLEDDYRNFIKKQQKLILSLVKKVSQQVIRCELRLQPQQIITLIEETLVAMPDESKKVKIHLEPNTVQELKNVASDKIKDWILIPDEKISAGGCRVVCDSCDADASIETRLDACIQEVGNHIEEMDLK